MAEGPSYADYSGRDVTGGLVVRISIHGNLIVREMSGKERHFHKLSQDDDPPPFRFVADTVVEIDGHGASFSDIKVGMRVQIVFYTRTQGKTTNGTEGDPLGITSIKAKSNSAEEPKS